MCISKVIYLRKSPILYENFSLTELNSVTPLFPLSAPLARPNVLRLPGQKNSRPSLAQIPFFLWLCKKLTLKRLQHLIKHFKRPPTT